MKKQIEEYKYETISRNLHMSVRDMVYNYVLQGWKIVDKIEDDKWISYIFYKITK